MLECANNKYIVCPTFSLPFGEPLLLFLTCTVSSLYSCSLAALCFVMLECANKLCVAHENIIDSKTHMEGLVLPEPGFTRGR